MSSDEPDFNNFIVRQTAENLSLRKPRTRPSDRGDFNKRWYEERLERAAFGKSKDIAQDNFMRRYPLFRDDPAEDAEWGPVRIVGEGGYGLVGLWEKRDKNNRTEDQIVIKQQSASEDAEYTYDLNAEYYPHLLQEAVIHRDLNQKAPGVFPKLRAYKYLKKPDKKPRSGPVVPSAYRMYLENCPYGDLAHLRRLYYMWDQPIPELFLWNVLVRLALGGEALRAPPPEDSFWVRSERKKAGAQSGAVATPANTRGKGKRKAKGKGKGKKGPSPVADQEELPPLPFKLDHFFCLHSDMKPANVFLGVNEQNEAMDDARRHVEIDDPDYPLVKMGDFGVAEYTTWRDEPEINPLALWEMGTRGYRPPEQAQVGADWPIPPTGAAVRRQLAMSYARDDSRAQYSRDRGREPASAATWAAILQRHAAGKTESHVNDIVFDHALNIYGIGRTLYSLMCSAHGDADARDKPDRDTEDGDFKLYRNNRYHLIRKLRTQVRGFYTPRLRRLVWRCLDPNPANRPSQLELLDRAEHGLRAYKKHLHRMQKRGDALPELKLYYKGHEINDMQLGEFRHAPDMEDLRRIWRNVFINPDLPALKVPVEKYGRICNDYELRNLPRQNWRRYHSQQPDMNRWFQDPDTVTEQDEDEDEDSEEYEEEEEGEEEDGEDEEDGEEDEDEE